jgi:hypothetical protein
MHLPEPKENIQFSSTKDVASLTTPYAVHSHTCGDDDEELDFGNLRDCSRRIGERCGMLRFCGKGSKLLVMIYSTSD